MTLFAMTWLILVLGSAGLAVGAARGRPLRGGGCAAARAGGLQRLACEGCTPTERPARCPREMPRS